MRMETGGRCSCRSNQAMNERIWRSPPPSQGNSADSTLDRRGIPAGLKPRADLSPPAAALRARADRPQIVERVDPRAVAVGPIYTYRVSAHRLDIQHLKRGRVHLERVRGLGRSIAGLLRRGSVRAGAGGAGTLVAQVAQFVIAMMAVFPIDLNALRFGNGDVFGFRCLHSLVRCRGRRSSAG